MSNRVRTGVLSLSLAAIVVALTAVPALAAPTVASVTPPTGPNNDSSLVLTFTGTGMTAPTGATLHKAGQSDITGTSVSGSLTGTTGMATFNLATGSGGGPAAIGAWDVRVTDATGTGVCTACFTVTAANPTFAAMNPVTPNQAGQSATGITVKITGANYQSGAHVTFSNPAIGIDSTTFINAGEIDVVIHVSSTGAGTSDITITNPDLGSGTCAACFTINAKPTIISSSPSSAANTGPTTLTLTGTGFEATGTAKLTKTGQSDITGTNWTRNTATSLSIDFDLTDAAPGPWVISIVNGDGGPGSCSNCFTVTAAAPTVTSVSPDHKPQGVTTTVAINGTNLFPGATASFSGTGITVNSTTWVNNTQVSANITIAANATVSSRTATVTNTDGQAGTCSSACFSVTLPAPAIASVSPTSGHQGTTIDVTVTGSHFVSGATVSFSGTGINVNSSTFVDASHVTANITIDPGATVSSRDVTLTNPDAQADTCPGCFDVMLPAPTATGVSPTSGHRGTTIDVIVTGTNFVNGAMASFSGTGINVNSTTFNNAGQVTANITIDPAATLTSRDVTVTNPDTQAATCSGCFTVILPAPTATSVSPTNGEAGTTLTVTVTGTNFVSGATASFSGTGITVNSTTFNSATMVTANITISSSATLSARNVSVTNPDTQSATCGGCFTVTAAVTATLSAPATLTDPIGETFSADVGGVTTSNFVFGVTGSGTTLAGTLACKNVSNAATSCAGSSVRSAWLTPSTRLLPGQFYTVTLNPSGAPSLITDSAGAAIPTSSGAFRASRVEQETSLAESYRWRGVPASGALGGSYQTEHLAGATASFTFTGTSVRWYTVLGPNQGDATVLIDGVSHGRVDNYHRNTFVYGAFWSFSSLSSGTHTMVIIIDGIKGSPIGTGTYVSVDGMQVGAGSVQSNPSLTYRWRTAPSAIAFGGHYAISDVAGASTYFSFRGTRVDWYSIFGPSGGRAAIYIDGALKGTVDTYRSSTMNVRVILGNLTNTVHTIRILVLGTRSAASHGTNVIIDRWAIG